MNTEICQDYSDELNIDNLVTIKRKVKLEERISTWAIIVQYYMVEALSVCNNKRDLCGDLNDEQRFSIEGSEKCILAYHNFN